SQRWAAHDRRRALYPLRCDVPGGHVYGGGTAEHVDIERPAPAPGRRYGAETRWGGPRDARAPGGVRGFARERTGHSVHAAGPRWLRDAAHARFRRVTLH